MEKFFSRVLPSTGDYVVVAIRPDLPQGAEGKATDIRGITSQAAVVASVRKLSTKPLDLYVAIGSYKYHRKKPLLKRALFLDLDAKHFEPAEKATAARELGIFCRATGFPMPAVINDSGGGLHCYWPFDRDIAVAEWKVLADALKRKCQTVEFHADHPITADAGRILRVPGTLNYKYTPPIPCRELRDTGEMFDPDTLLEQLGGPVTDDAFEEGECTVTSAPNAIENTLGGGLEERPPLTADQVRAMLGYVAIQSGDGQWSRVLSGIHDWSAGSEEGFQIFHDWSKAQPGYASERDCRYRWRSFGKPGGFSRRNVTIATVVMIAKDNGWELETEEAEEEPEPVEAAEPEEAAPMTLGQQAQAAFKTHVASQVTQLAASKHVMTAKAMGLMRKNKITYATSANAEIAIRVLLGGRFWFDTFKQKLLTDLNSAHEVSHHVSPRPWTDLDDIRVQVLLQQTSIPTISLDAVRGGIATVANDNTRNVVTDWLDSLQWDGKRRLTNLMRLGFGTRAHRYYMRTGRNWLISMVARAYDPGCQVDTATILEGPQGGLKSSALRIIGGEHYRELTADPSTKDFEQQLRGVWLGEFAELATIRRSEDVQRLKQFITNRVDHYRPSYGRHEIDVPRTTVFCGTTNEGTWINDQTGARRFIPVDAGAINLDWLRVNREQLFAEAVTLYKADRSWWHWPKKAAALMQAARTAVHPWFDDVVSYMKGLPVGSHVLVRDLAIRVLGIPLSQQTAGTNTLIGHILAKLGCSCSRHRIGGVVTRTWQWNGMPQ